MTINHFYRSLIAIPLICLMGCSEPKTKSVFDIPDYNANIMHMDMSNDFKKAKAAFDKSDNMALQDADLWIKQALQDIETAKNDQPYFKTCAKGYIALDGLMNLYHEAMNKALSKHPIHPKTIKTQAIVEAEKSTRNMIGKCSSININRISQ